MGDKTIKMEQQEDDDNAGKQQEKQLWPPKKMTKNFKGGQRDYNFQQTVKSVDELDKFRFKHSCRVGMGGRKPLPNFESHTMPCTKRYQYQQEKCEFELLAVRQDSDTIHIYAYSQHNHPIMPEEKRAHYIPAKELMPAEKPPKIYRTEDNIEWTFVQTFADYDQLQKYRRKSQCTIDPGRKTHLRVRLRCSLTWKWKQNCKFQLLALKTTKQGYHVYAFGEHSHPVKPMKKRQQKQQEMEADEEEDDEEEDDEDGQEEEEESEYEDKEGRQQKHQEMEVDEEEEEDGQEEDEEGEGQAEDEPIEEGGGGGEEEDDIIVIDDEDDGIKVEQHPKVKQEGALDKTTGTPQGNEAAPKEETLEETLKKAEVNGYYEWMAQFEPNQIEPKVAGLNTASLFKMVELADQEVQQHPAKFDKWRPWLKHAMPKCMSEVEDVYSKYKHLTGLMFRHVKD